MLGVVLDGEVGRVDAATSAVVSSIRERVPNTTFVVTATGSLAGGGRGEDAHGIAADVDAALGAPVVAEVAADGLFLDRDVLVDRSLTAQQVADAMRARRRGRRTALRRRVPVVRRRLLEVLLMAVELEPRAPSSAPRTRDRSRPPVAIVIVGLLAVAVLVRVVDPSSLPWLRNLLIVFGSLLVEAMPFILLGATVSAAIEVLVPASAFARIALLPRGLQLPAAAAAGVAFPVCECGSVPSRGGSPRRASPRARRSRSCWPPRS